MSRPVGPAQPLGVSVQGGLMEAHTDQGWARLERLCRRHWLRLMATSFLDTGDSDVAEAPSGDGRRRVLEKALSCEACRKRNGLPPLAEVDDLAEPAWRPPVQDSPGPPVIQDSPMPPAVQDSPGPPAYPFWEPPSAGPHHPEPRISRKSVVAALAVAAFVLGSAGALAWAVHHDLSRAPVSSSVLRSVDVNELRVGECVRDMKADSEGFVPDVVEVVACTDPHTDEVFATFSLPRTAYPGAKRVTAMSDAGCDRRFEKYVGKSVSLTDLDVWITEPPDGRWPEDRVVVCTAAAPENKANPSSVRNSGR